MKKTAYLLLVIFSFLIYSCIREIPTVITGHLTNISDTSLTVEIGKDPITGLEPAGYPRVIRIGADGTFSVSLEVPFPFRAVLYTENGGFVANVRLVHAGEIHLTADCEDFRNTLEYHGSGSSLNDFYYDHMKFRRAERKKFSSGHVSLTDYERRLDSLNAISLQMLKAYHAYESLTEEELMWLTSEFNYGKYSSLNRRAHQLNLPLSDSTYRFFEELDLNDHNAVIISRTYVNSILQYILYEVNAMGIYHSQFGDNSSFYREYYKTIKEKLEGKVRDVILSNFISDMLNDHVVFSVAYYEKYLSDCQSQEMIEKTSKLYEEYLAVAEKPLHDNVILIPTNHQSPSKVLSQFEDKVIFLDFWASWCSPCIESLPHTKELTEHYANQPVEVIFVGNNDQESSLIHAIKEYELLGNHIILDEKDSETWRSTFDISGIPTYVLLDMRGKRIKLGNSHRISSDTYETIDSVLSTI